MEAGCTFPGPLRLYPPRHSRSRVSTRAITLAQRKLHAFRTRLLAKSSTFNLNTKASRAAFRKKRVYDGRLSGEQSQLK
eukprot:2733564-Rhodomonas_salina.1